MKTILTCLTAMAAFTAAHAGDNCRQTQSTHTTVQTQGPACQAAGLISGTAHHSTTGHLLIAHPSPNAAAETNQKKDIVDTAVAAGSFNTLVAAVQAAGLVETLKGTGPFTVFAPTDEAFAKIPKETIAELLKPENKETLKSILLYHVVPGNVKAATVVNLTSAQTAQGQQVNIAVKDGMVSVDSANVVKTDIETSNGVIHVIDTVIMPNSKDIVDTAVEAKTFSTLVAAVQAAGLVDTLKGPGPFTVFAPSDDAFAKLPQSTIADLLKPENKDQLIAILTYHVVPGKVLAADAVKIKSAKTVNGKEVNVMAEGNGVMINKAQVVAADVETSNGVIHVIDSVLLP
jgi:transforming growth factor-beta-induced protein